MGNRTKEDELYREMCRVVGKVVLEMRDLGQEPKHIVIAGVLRTALANKRIQRSELEKQDDAARIETRRGWKTGQPLWEVGGRVLRQLNMGPPRDPAIPPILKN